MKKLIKQAVSKELTNFLYQYILNKRNIASILFRNKFFPDNRNEFFGHFKPDGITQNSYKCYADLATETLMEKLKIVMENHTKLKLESTYSYLRVYEHGDKVPPHRDRHACQITISLHIGGDTKWPFYVQEKKKNKIFNLNPGDMLIYDWTEKHWRNPYEGTNYVQIFMHYIDINNPITQSWAFDKRPTIGLPNQFVGKTKTL